ncbi:MAG: 2-oxo acid dehydrogenase subunit E2 [Gemmatimonadetes bacterium]|nr:2-oxo acid dehydrogenase subunit E2 [Gemmatimonadota bacterium]
MPQMGESIAEGTMSRWLKKVGDAVKRDEPLFEISTDKVDAEIPSPSAGTLAEILVIEGQTVPVQTVVARLETDASVAVSPTAAAPAPVAAVAAPVVPASPAQAAPSVPVPTQPAAAPGSFEDRIRSKSSPLVRKMAAEHGVELSSLSGSGVAGRVTRKDLVGFLESGAARPATPSVVAPMPMASSYAPGGFGFDPPAVEPWPGDVVEPMSKIRRLTAGHMVYSKHTSAHVTSFFEVDLTRVSRVRAALRADFEKQHGEKLTYLPFITQAVVQGLQKFPVLNAAIRGQDIVFRKSYNIGIAVAMDWGLIVPVVKRADTLNLVGLTKGINDLATRARSKRLKPEDVQDATFTITNPGVFGSVMGTPIIPQPTVAILCVGTIEKRPKVRTGPDGEDTIAIRTCTYLSISFDHRIVDGADADQFMAFVKQTLETWPEAGR